MRVLVTGANGHVGYNLVAALAARGHDVTATIRSLDDAAKAAPLRAIEGVMLSALNIRDPDAFRRAAAGMDIIFHVAATYTNVVRSPEEAAELMRDSIDGATAAIKAAAGGNAGRVVMTSSIVTLPVRKRGEAPVDETEWKTSFAIPYEEAKTRAEQAAWQLAKEEDVALATILPGMVTGPGFRRRTPSIDIIEAVMKGAFRLGVPGMMMPTYVDVRDVVSAHILVAEKQATGRYVVCNDKQVTLLDVVRTVKKIDPSTPLLPIEMPAIMDAILPAFDWLNSKVLGTRRTMSTDMHRNYNARSQLAATPARIRTGLGWTQSIPFETSIADTMDGIRDLWAREKRTGR